MNDLKHIICAFSSEEQEQFVAQLRKKNKRKDSKNIDLFKLLSQEDVDENTICKRIYGAKTAQAYHALRKRLLHALIQFTANSSLQQESSLEMQIITYILAARSFLQREQFRTAFTILNKAETAAKAQYAFALLNEIYSTKIQFAHHLPELKLNQLIEKLNENKARYQLENDLNIVYAKMRKEIEQHPEQDFHALLTTTQSTYNIDVLNKLSFKALYQLISIASISAFATKDYLNIENFLIKCYNSIITRSNTQQPYYHIEILYQIANTLFRNKKFKASKAYLEKMHAIMLTHKAKLYNTFIPKYNLLLALNYNYSNASQKAITLLEMFLNKKHQNIKNLLDLQLSLLMFYFQNNNLKAAHSISAKWRHSDKWYIEKTDIEWVLKKNLIEILLHIDLEHFDLVISKLASFKRNYYPYLKAIKEERAITFIELVKTYFNTPEIVTSTQFKDKVEQAFIYKTNAQEDIFVMSFYAWLKAKMTNASLYETTLAMVTLKN